jgi:hypothetical protein
LLLHTGERDPERASFTVEDDEAVVAGELA